MKIRIKDKKIKLNCPFCGKDCFADTFRVEHISTNTTIDIEARYLCTDCRSYGDIHGKVTEVVYE